MHDPTHFFTPLTPAFVIRSGVRERHIDDANPTVWMGPAPRATHRYTLALSGAATLEIGARDPLAALLLDCRHAGHSSNCRGAGLVDRQNQTPQRTIPKIRPAWTNWKTSSHVAHASRFAKTMRMGEARIVGIE
ncbi:hypothetical protein LCGC14_2866260 [marine sediment metagenome]|uniref:Uncharacterized protein n=1 Tax=marine sediment metagenome TaxID=412755 RepID=A0A0F8Y4F7_9ZZZZ